MRKVLEYSEWEDSGRGGELRPKVEAVRVCWQSRAARKGGRFWRGGERA